MKKPLIWLLVVLTSCQAIHKSQDANRLRKAQDQFKLHPESFAELSAKYYPSRDTAYVRDSIRFDTLYTPGPEQTTIEYRQDTVFKTITMPGATRFITKTVVRDSLVIRRDNAAESVLNELIRARDKTVADTSAQFADLKSSRGWYRSATFITWGILLAFIIGWIIAKIYGK